MYDRFSSSVLSTTFNALFQLVQLTYCSNLSRPINLNDLLRGEWYHRLPHTINHRLPHTKNMRMI